MKLKKLIFIFLSGSIYLLLPAILAGCSSTPKGYDGLTVPPDIQALVFSYSGYASESSTGSTDRRDGGASWNFWKTPHD